MDEQARREMTRSEAIGWLVSSVGRKHLERQAALAGDENPEIAAVLLGWAALPSGERTYFTETAQDILERLVAFAASNPWTGLSDDERSRAFVAADAERALRTTC